MVFPGIQHGIDGTIHSPSEVTLGHITKMPKNSTMLFVSNISGRQDSLGKDRCTRRDDTMKPWDWIKLHHKNCQVLIRTDLVCEPQLVRDDSLWGTPHYMNTRDCSYSTGCNLWFTNIDLPNGWKIRPTRFCMNPNNCLMGRCYIIPYNGEDYIGPHGSVMGTRGNVRDLFSFEMEKLTI